MMVDTVIFCEIHHKSNSIRPRVTDALKEAHDLAYNISVFNERRQFNYFEFMHKFFCEYLPQQKDLTCHDIGMITNIVASYIDSAIDIPMSNEG